MINSERKCRWSLSQVKLTQITTLSLLPILCKTLLATVVSLGLAKSTTENICAYYANEVAQNFKLHWSDKNYNTSEIWHSAPMNETLQYVTDLRIALADFHTRTSLKLFEVLIQITVKITCPLYQKWYCFENISWLQYFSDPVDTLYQIQYQKSDDSFYDCRRLTNNLNVKVL